MNFIRGMNPAESLILGKWSKVGRIEIYFKTRIKHEYSRRKWQTLFYASFKLFPPYRENFRICLKHEEQKALNHRKKFDAKEWKYEIIISGKNKKKLWGQNRYLKDII